MQICTQRSSHCISHDREPLTWLRTRSRWIATSTRATSFFGTIHTTLLTLCIHHHHHSPGLTLLPEYAPQGFQQEIHTPSPAPIPNRPFPSLVCAFWNCRIKPRGPMGAI